MLAHSIVRKRYGTGEEVAATLAFMVSDGAAYVSGQNINVDNGLTRGSQTRPAVTP